MLRGIDVNLFEKPWSWLMSACPLASWYTSVLLRYCTPVNKQNRIYNCCTFFAGCFCSLCAWSWNVPWTFFWCIMLWNDGLNLSIWIFHHFNIRSKWLFLHNYIWLLQSWDSVQLIQRKFLLTLWCTDGLICEPTKVEGAINKISNLNTNLQW